MLKSTQLGRDRAGVKPHPILLTSRFYQHFLLKKEKDEGRGKVKKRKRKKRAL